MLKKINKHNILKNNRGIALVTVILVIAILGLLAAVAIETTGSDVINAGNNTANQYTTDLSYSSDYIILSQIGTNSGIDEGIGAGGMPLPGYYYYTINPNVNVSSVECVDMQNNTPDAQQLNQIYNIYTSPVPSVANFITCPPLTANNINPVTQQDIVNPQNQPQNNGQIGFSFFGSYSNAKGYGNNVYFYNGQIDAISQNNRSLNASPSTVHTGMTFQYGPLQEGG